jgi:hypothetical protein
MWSSCIGMGIRNHRMPGATSTTDASGAGAQRKTMDSAPGGGAEACRSGRCRPWLLLVSYPESRRRGPAKTSKRTMPALCLPDSIDTLSPARSSSMNQVHRPPPPPSTGGPI